jgi:hypothetical protein
MKEKENPKKRRAIKRIDRKRERERERESGKSMRTKKKERGAPFAVARVQ